MRKLTALIMAVLLIGALSLGVSAGTGVSKQESFATVSADGSVQVSLTVSLHLESSVDKLYFPVPANAAGITLNGSRVSASRDGDVRNINISRLTKNVVGDVTFSVHYSIHDVVDETESGLMLQLPLLSGFSYPVNNLSFSVTFPGQINTLPGFTSGYHQARIEEDLTYAVDGATVSGSSLKAMKDHETLFMTLAVSEEMFPQSIVQSRDYGWGTTAMVVCGALALLYWLIALWNLPVLPQRTAQPPHGFHPGQAGSILAGEGLNLTMAVFGWAQLGYLTISISRSGRVVLHKRMEMGNERSEWECRVFQKLFGKRTQVDTMDYRYAQLVQQCAKRPVGMAELLRRWSGKPEVFRFLAAMIGLFGGAALAVAISHGAALQGLLIVLLAILGALSGWHIQSFGAGVLTGNRRKLTKALVLTGIWLIAGALAGAFSVGAGMVASLLVAGLLLSWGGRRTGQGRQVLAQTLGLKWYLHRAGKKEVQRICEAEPDYFFRMLPWAMALGADRSFAKAFGARKLESCPYCITDSATALSAMQWTQVMHRAEKAMNHRAEGMALERLAGFVRTILRG